MNDESKKARVHQVEMIISTLLRVGVISSLSIVILGTILSFSHHADYTSSPEELTRLTRPPAAFPRSVSQVISGLRGFEGRAVVTVGLLLLIATPVMRVGVSVFIFLHQEDYTFVIITSVVLALLLLSFVLGRAEG
jgi:uncharacterized membrane protein